MAKIALLRPGAIGDILMALNFVQQLQKNNDVTFFNNFINLLIDIHNIDIHNTRDALNTEIQQKDRHSAYLSR